ncbi:Ubiquitin domain [Carpediemonas membranifera]|uniref:Ubiquitin domain n=1 Tax=Carpediemonas membranifera TaxID=201153 RepID=A0A8J6B4U3_9EUKA|nr:Ubiquitin domain [Carpediemonas membranifera]|eukprot:KAG9394324.1 Ubiquitin domain [Carpediemonas membranifera]
MIHQGQQLRDETPISQTRLQEGDRIHTVTRFIPSSRQAETGPMTPPAAPAGPDGERVAHVTFQMPTGSDQTPQRVIEGLMANIGNAFRGMPNANVMNLGPGMFGVGNFGLPGTQQQTPAAAQSGADVAVEVAATRTGDAQHNVSVDGAPIMRQLSQAFPNMPAAATTRQALDNTIVALTAVTRDLERLSAQLGVHDVDPSVDSARSVEQSAGAAVQKLKHVGTAALLLHNQLWHTGPQVTAPENADARWLDTTGRALASRVQTMLQTDSPDRVVRARVRMTFAGPQPQPQSESQQQPQSQPQQQQRVGVVDQLLAAVLAAVPFPSLIQVLSAGHLAVVPTGNAAQPAIREILATHPDLVAAVREDFESDLDPGALGQVPPEDIETLSRHAVNAVVSMVQAIAAAEVSAATEVQCGATFFDYILAGQAEPTVVSIAGRHLFGLIVRLAHDAPRLFENQDLLAVVLGGFLGSDQRDLSAATGLVVRAFQDFLARLHERGVTVDHPIAQFGSEPCPIPTLRREPESEPQPEPEPEELVAEDEDVDMTPVQEPPAPAAETDVYSCLTADERSVWEPAVEADRALMAGQDHPAGSRIYQTGKE